MGRTLIARDRDEQLSKVSVPITHRGRTFWCLERHQPMIESKIYFHEHGGPGKPSVSDMQSVVKLLSTSPLPGTTTKPPCR